MHLPVSKRVENDSAQDASPTVSAYGGELEHANRGEGGASSAPYNRSAQPANPEIIQTS